MSDEEDPEVLADIALREHTAATRPRMSEADFAAAIRQTASPNVIGVVPCRARCGAVVDWTAEAEQAFELCATDGPSVGLAGQPPDDLLGARRLFACRRRTAREDRAAARGLPRHRLGSSPSPGRRRFDRPEALL